MQQHKYGKVALIITTLTLPVSALLSSIVEYVLKTKNPRHIDVTTQLAYLRPILGTLIICFATFVVLSLVFSIAGLKKDTDKTLAKVNVLVLVAVTVLSVAAGGFQSATHKTETHYTNVTTTNFFKELSR